MTTFGDGDTTPINDPNRDVISDFSKTTRENTGLFGVPTVFETSVSHVSHGSFALQRKPRKHASGNRCKTGKEKKQKSRCQGSVDGTVLGLLLFRLTENSFLMNEISENILNDELNKLLLVEIQLGERVVFD